MNKGPNTYLRPGPDPIPSLQENEQKREQQRESERRRRRVQQGPMLNLPLTNEVAAKVSARLAEALAARGQRGVLSALAQHVEGSGHYYRLTDLTVLQRKLNPALRALMVTVKGPVASEARRFYLALWEDVTNGVLGVPESYMREHWAPLLDDAKRTEAEAFLDQLIRQPAEKTDTRGAFTFLQRVMKNRDVFNALLGESEVSEILTLLASPAWDQYQGQTQMQPPAPMPMPGMATMAPPAGLAQQAATRNRAMLAQTPQARQGSNAFGQMLANARPGLVSPLAAEMTRQGGV